MTDGMVIDQISAPEPKTATNDSVFETHTDRQCVLVFLEAPLSIRVGEMEMLRKGTARRWAVLSGILLLAIFAGSQTASGVLLPIKGILHALNGKEYRIYNNIWYSPHARQRLIGDPIASLPRMRLGTANEIILSGKTYKDKVNERIVKLIRGRGSVVFLRGDELEQGQGPTVLTLLDSEMTAYYIGRHTFERQR